MPRLGRPGVPLAVVGLARALGRPALPRALVALWWIPVPDFLVNRLAPGLETIVPWLCAGAAQALGIDASWTRGSEFHPAAGGRLFGPGGALLFDPADGGLPLAVVLAGLGWYRAAGHGGPLARCAASALRVAPWAIPIQALGLVATCAVAIAGSPFGAGLLLHYGLWMAAAGGFHLRARRTPP
jgi:hypothetical protein